MVQPQAEVVVQRKNEGSRKNEEQSDETGFEELEVVEYPSEVASWPVVSVAR